MDKIFKAMADKNRRLILTLLKAGPMSVGEIVKRMSIGQPTVSSHLSVLRKAKLIEVEIVCRMRIYRLNGEVMSLFVKELEKFAGRNEAPPVDEIIIRK